MNPARWYIVFWLVAMGISWLIALGILWELHRLIEILSKR